MKETTNKIFNKLSVAFLYCASLVIVVAFTWINITDKIQEFLLIIALLAVTMQSLFLLMASFVAEHLKEKRNFIKPYFFLGMINFFAYVGFLIFFSENKELSEIATKISAMVVSGIIAWIFYKKIG